MPFDAQNDIMVQSRPTYNLVCLLLEIGCQESYPTIRTIIQYFTFERPSLQNLQAQSPSASQDYQNPNPGHFLQVYNHFEPLHVRHIRHR